MRCKKNQLYDRQVSQFTEISHDLVTDSFSSDFNPSSRKIFGTMPPSASNILYYYYGLILGWNDNYPTLD